MAKTKTFRVHYSDGWVTDYKVTAVVGFLKAIKKNKDVTYVEEKMLDKIKKV